MEQSIAVGLLPCRDCGHPGISHTWEDVYDMGIKDPVGQVSVGCRVYTGRPTASRCTCGGFVRDVERPQERLI